MHQTSDLTRRQPQTRRGLLLLLAWLELVGGIAVLGIESAMGQAPHWLLSVLGLANVAILLCFSLRIALAAWRRPAVLRRPRVIAALLAVAGLSLIDLRLSAGAALIHDSLASVARFRQRQKRDAALARAGNKPARALVTSFLTLIAIGTILLSLPAASATGQSTALIDAFFTAVSATCITGLATVDTGSTWSTFGLSVILVLIQLGGMGIMAVAGAMALTIGGSLDLGTSSALGEVYDEGSTRELKHLLRGIVGWTLAIEAAGTLLLFMKFRSEQGWQEALFSALFHAVSSFCHAGFSLFSDSFSQYANDPAVNLVVCSLVLTGSLGFSVIVMLAAWIGSRGRNRLSVHAKLVLVTTALLIWGGTIFYFFVEYSHSLSELPLGGKLLAAFFQSVNARTAGLNTVPLDNIQPATILTLIVLMFIGASPGSTGGGVKTTTVALVVLAARAFLLERTEVEAFGRRIPQQQILRALALIGGAALTFFCGFTLLLLSESLPFELLAFEAVSALATTGLSMGATPLLSSTGKVIVCVMMFAGRVGPLTAVAAAARRSHSTARIQLPEGKVLVG